MHTLQRTVSYLISIKLKLLEVFVRMTLFIPIVMKVGQHALGTAY